VVAEVVRQLTRDGGGHALPRERACILVEGRVAEARAARVLERAGVDLGQVDFFRVPTDRSWTRDYCPLFVRRHADRGGRREVAITNWRFNGWAKYPNWRRDDAVPARLARALGLREFEPALGGRRLVLEGGAIDVNGLGTLLTTDECLISEVQARNPGLPRAEIERALEENLGARKVIWLGRGITGDDTHGHVDDLARFVGPRTVVCCEEDDRSDPNFVPLAQNRALLEEATDQDGVSLTVVPLPMPAPLYFDGVRLPASYANFYIGNRAVLVPTFNDPRDRQALATLERFFPGRAIVPIHALDLVWGFGTIHCMTQQEPA
jgi:agmatine deiminase